MDHQHCQTCYGLALSPHLLADVRQASVSLTRFPPTLSKIGGNPHLWPWLPWRCRPRARFKVKFCLLTILFGLDKPTLSFNECLFPLLIVRVPVVFLAAFKWSTWHRAYFFCCWCAGFGADLQSQVLPLVFVLAAVCCCAIRVHEEASVTAGGLSSPHQLWQHWHFIHHCAWGCPSCVHSCDTLDMSLRFGSHQTSALFPGTWNTLALSGDAWVVHYGKAWLWSHQLSVSSPVVSQAHQWTQMPTCDETFELPVSVAHFF